MSTIFLGADHAGFVLKEKIKAALQKDGFLITDISPTFHAGDDYPSIAKNVAMRVAKQKNGRGILICGSGSGMTIAADRIRGARATDVETVREAKNVRKENDGNILVLGARETKTPRALAIVRAWIATPFSKEKRHARRIKQIDQP